MREGHMSELIAEKLPNRARSGRDERHLIRQTRFEACMRHIPIVGFKSKKNSAFTLVELMIVIAIVGLIACVAIPVFLNYIKQAKLIEGPILLQTISEGEIAFYNSPRAGADGKDFPSGFLKLIAS